VNAALGASNLTDEQRIALLSFLVDVQRARKDAAAEQQAAAKLDEVLAKDPRNPAAGQAIARRVLQSAQRSLDAKDYPKVIAEIDQNRAAFTEPMQQAEALWDLAEARLGLAQPKKDPNALRDAALAYMRIVAHFGELPNKPRVAAALLKTAAIEEQLGERDEALRLYQQVASQFPDDPIAAPAAKENAQRLTTR
jgi:TolA-binding protein